MALYFYYGGGRLPALCFFYEVRYRVGLYDDTMRRAVAESVADRYAVGVEPSVEISGLTMTRLQVMQELRRAFALLRTQNRKFASASD